MGPLGSRAATGKGTSHLSHHGIQSDPLSSLAAVPSLTGEVIFAVLIVKTVL